MKILIVLLLCAILQGCFFFMVPGSAIDAMTGNSGNVCLGSAAKVGDRVSINGRTMKVTEINGASGRCQSVYPTLGTAVIDSV